MFGVQNYKQGNVDLDDLEGRGISGWTAMRPCQVWRRGVEKGLSDCLQGRVSTGGRSQQKASHQRPKRQEGPWHTDSRKSPRLGPEQKCDLIKDRVTDRSGLRTNEHLELQLGPTRSSQPWRRSRFTPTPHPNSYTLPTTNTQGKGFNNLLDCQQQPIESYQWHRHIKLS